MVITDGGGGREAKVLEVSQAVGLVLRLSPGPALFLLGHSGRSPPPRFHPHTHTVLKSGIGTLQHISELYYRNKSVKIPFYS